MFILLICTFLLNSVLGCDPVVSVPFWSSTDGYWDSILGKTTQGGLVLLYDTGSSRLRHVLLSGSSDWAYNLTQGLFPELMVNDIIYVNLFNELNSYHYVVRIDSNTGKFDSNLPIEVQDTSEGYLITIGECDNILYSTYGDIFDVLMANDLSTGNLLWQTPYEGVKTIKFSEDCKYVTFVLDPIDNNLNFSLVRLDAKTGKEIWETSTLVKRPDGLWWDWAVYESVAANRVAVARYHPFGFYWDQYSFQLFTANSGMKTFEKNFPGSAGTVVINAPIGFSPDGSMAIFSPLESNGIKIGENEDVLIWSTDEKDGITSLIPYFSSTSNTFILNLWNYGNTKYIAQNTKDGSTLWESSWYPFVFSDFFEIGDDIVVLGSSKQLFKVDIKNCPFP